MRKFFLLILLIYANFALSDDRALSIEADTINSDNNIIDANGNVVVKNDGKKLLTDKLKYDKDKKVIYTESDSKFLIDDNVLFFFRKDLSDPNNIKYIAVDWYGRIVGNEWEDNRQNHNRRVCYEFARVYAKAIKELLDDNNNLDVFMLGDKENLHYVVGLTGPEYSVILDLDDFNSIKDLTRLKLGLTIKGIRILRDNSGKFKDAINKFK